MSTSAVTPHGLPPTDAPGEQPLSEGQRALWFLDRLDPGAAACHLAGAARVLGGRDPEAARVGRAPRCCRAGRAPGPAAGHRAGAARVLGGLDPEAVRRALALLAARHPA